MKTFSLALLSTFLLISAPGLATDSDVVVPYKWGEYKESKLGKKPAVIIVNWFSPEGRKRLARSKFTTDFYQLAHFYQPQINPVYAGIATSVVLLNAMRVPQHRVPSQKEAEIAKPQALGGGLIPYPAYSQHFFLNEATDKVKDRKLVVLQNATPENTNDKSAFKPGTSLEELKGLLGVYGAEVDVVLAKMALNPGAKGFRNTLKKVLRDETRFLLVNFKGDDLGASTEGTVSPLAAYDESSDSVLILDVTGHKNPWYWVPLEALYQSMHTQYGNDQWRGYAIVSESGARKE